MKRKIFIPLLILFLVSVGSRALFARDADPDKTSLSGKITDKDSGEPVPGVYVYIPGLKTGGVTDLNGNYMIGNLPATKVLVQVSFVGYKNILETIDLQTTTVRDFILEPSAIEMNEVVVTGSARPQELKHTPTPVTVIKNLALRQNASSNIIDAIAKQPGISEITTGPGISKPVIRGLGYNRVVVVNDGIRQEGQQWGDEHGIEIDESSVNKVEIIKGPASLAYGSDAMAGVINMISSPVLQEGQVTGNISANYQTNNGLFGYSANLAGNKSGLVWDARYSNKRAHAYRNRYDGYVFNSGFRENAANGLVGFNKSWGYTHLILSLYDLEPGIIEGERDSATGKFIKPVEIRSGSINQFPQIPTEGRQIASEADFKSYTPQIPYQKIRHYKAVLNSNFMIGQGNLKTVFGFQQNRRREFADILSPGRYGLYFLLNTFTYDAQYNFPEKRNLDISLGAGGMQQASSNQGTEYLIPAYDLFENGFFTTIKKSWDRLDLSGGIRYDIRFEHVDPLYLDSAGMKTSPATNGATEKFRGFRTTFSGISGGLGISYDLSETMVARFNISRGFRAPNIAELGANGVHEGTIRYETGNPDLKAEGSWQFDYGLGFSTHHVSGELDLFDNEINNFIFLRRLTGAAGGDSLREGFQAFTYQAGHAHLYGGEFRLDIHPHPLDWIHFENSFSYVNTIQRNRPDSTKHLPFTPAPRWQSGLRLDARTIGRLVRNGYVKLDMENYFRQDRIYSAYRTETPTPGYSLLDFGLGGDIVSGNRTLFSLYFSINNLTDAAYQNHLSRLKYADVNNVTGRTGVFNMGRNISFRLNVPLNFAGKDVADNE